MYYHSFKFCYILSCLDRDINLVELTLSFHISYIIFANRERLVYYNILIRGWVFITPCYLVEFNNIFNLLVTCYRHFFTYVLNIQNTILYTHSVTVNINCYKLDFHYMSYLSSKVRTITICYQHYVSYTLSRFDGKFKSVFRIVIIDQYVGI